MFPFNKVLSSTLVAGLLLSHGAALAAPVTINVTGNVVASPCTISSASVTQNIDLGNGSDITVLTAPDGWTEYRPVQIKLTGCPTGTSTATLTFEGTPDADYPSDMYANAGTAANWAVSLLTEDYGDLGNGLSYTKNVVSGAVDFNMVTRARNKGPGFATGSIKATVTASIAYN